MIHKNTPSTAPSPLGRFTPGSAVTAAIIGITALTAGEVGTAGAQEARQRTPAAQTGSSSPKPKKAPAVNPIKSASTPKSPATPIPSSIGMIGVNPTDGGAAPWGRDDSYGTDPVYTRGNMWGDSIGDSFGAGGLGLSGLGEPRTQGEGIGLGSIGTIGHGAGTGTGQGFGRLGSTYRRSPTINVNMPGEVIQRIIRNNFPKMREAYDKLLKKHPNLSVHTRIRFTINKDGSVQVNDIRSSTTDQQFNDAIRSVIGSMKFPQPEGGSTTIVYPITFSPSAEEKAPGTPPWPTDGNLGSDPVSARGNMWGDSIGEAFGTGGLGLSGLSEPRMQGEGIGLGSIGTIGHGAGTGRGQGFGSGYGRLGGSHRTRPPQVRMGTTPPPSATSTTTPQHGPTLCTAECECKCPPKAKKKAPAKK